MIAVQVLIQLLPVPNVSRDFVEKSTRQIVRTWQQDGFIPGIKISRLIKVEAKIQPQRRNKHGRATAALMKIKRVTNNYSQ